MTDRKATSIRLSAEADRLLDQLAAKLGTKRSSVIEQAIRKMAEGEHIMSAGQTLGLTDAQVDFYTQRIEQLHPGWRVDQRYLTNGWAVAVYDEFRMLGEYHRGNLAALRRLAGIADEPAQ